MGINWKSIKKDGYPKEEGVYLVTRSYLNDERFPYITKFTNDLNSINEYTFPSSTYKGKKGFYEYNPNRYCYELKDVIAWEKIELYDENYNTTDCQDLAIQDELHDKLRNRLRKFTRDHGWSEDIWKDFEGVKYYISYDKLNKEYLIFNNMYIKRNEVYFISGDVADRAIEEVIKPFVKEHKEFIW